MPDHAHVIFYRGCEYIGRIAAEGMARKFKEPVPGGRNYVLNRKSGIINSVFATHKVLRYQRTVHPGQHVAVHRVHFAKGRAHLAAFGNKAGRQRSEGDVTLFQVDSGFAEGEEEVASRVRIDNGLKAYFGFMHLQRCPWSNPVMTQS